MSERERMERNFRPEWCPNCRHELSGQNISVSVGAETENHFGIRWTVDCHYCGASYDIELRK